MTLVPEVWEGPHRPDYRRIAALEHREEERRPGAFLPHAAAEVRAACADPRCAPEPGDAKVIELRPGAAADAPDDEPGTPEERETEPVPAVPETAAGDVVEGIVVDPPDALPWQRRDTRVPVFPPWMRDPVQWRAAARWALDRAGYKAAFHALRAPKYAGRLAVYAPRGAWRGIRFVWRWVFDAEGMPLRHGAVAGNDAGTYLALSRQRNERVKIRGFVLLGAAGASGIALTVVYFVAPTAFDLLITGAILAAGWFGRRPDRPLFDAAIIEGPRGWRLTPDMVVRAYMAAKLCTEAEPITFAPGRPVHRDGDGWLAVVDLPFGKKAADALKKVEDIAAGLDVDEVRVFLERVRGDSGSARRVEMWVANRDPYGQLPPVTPLADMAQVDFWKPIPFGLDARRRPIAFSLVWSSLLVGSIPRMGKTFAARLPVAAAALDPYVRMYVFDGKGGRDWKAFEQVAHRYGTGIRVTVVEHLVATLQELVEEMNRRYEAFNALPDDLCPEGKLTPGLARDRRRNMPLELVAIDEIQRYLEHEQYGKLIADLLTDLVKVGPAAGIMLVLATQKPDSKAIPSKLRDSVGSRFALKTMTWQASEAILGTGTSKAGIDATRFQRSHKGVGYLFGADDGELAEAGAQVVRTHLADGPVITRICQRGRELRIAAGTLEGVAAGEEPMAERPVASLLDDVLAVFEQGEPRLWSETICARLAELRPEDYDGWDQTLFATAVKPFGIETTQMNMPHPVEGGRRNRQGITRRQVVDALAEQDPRGV